MFNLKQFFMQKKNLFASAFLCASMFLFTGCDKIMSHFDNSVDSNLKVADKLTIIGVGETYQIAKDVDYKTISDADPSFESLDKAIATVEPKTGLVTALKSGDARIKISLPDNGLYLDASAIINIKVRVHNTDEFNKNVKALADGDQILFAENAAVETKSVDMSGKKISILGVEGKPAILDLNGSLKITKGLEIKNVIFNITSAGNTNFIVVQPLSEDAPKEGGSYFAFEPITIENVVVNNHNACLIKGREKVVIPDIQVNNCVVEMRENCNSGIFNFDGGYPKNIEVKNSTFWSKGEGHKGYLFTIGNAKPADVSADATTSFSVDHCTMYKIAVAKAANNGSQAKGKSYLHVSLTNSILVDFGTSVGNEIKGWLFGQGSTNPTRVYKNNSYFNSNGTIVGGWTNSSKTGYDDSGTSLTTIPFAASETGNFKVTGAAQKEKETGDPRWLK